MENSPLEADSGSCDQEIVSILQNLKAYFTMYCGNCGWSAAWAEWLFWDVESYSLV